MFHTNSSSIQLPVPPAHGDEIQPSAPEAEAEEFRIYSRFIRYYQNVPNSRAEIKLLSSLQFVADILGYSDAHIAKILVDYGLRAPRLAFPASFLEYADAALLRDGWEVGAPSEGLKSLKAYWDLIGEERPKTGRWNSLILEDARVF